MVSVVKLYNERCVFGIDGDTYMSYVELYGRGETEAECRLDVFGAFMDTSVMMMAVNDEDLPKVVEGHLAAQDAMASAAGIDFECGQHYPRQADSPDAAPQTLTGRGRRPS
jgi:hypothetical protein